MTSDDPTELGPIDPGDRVVMLDALRGAALFGVLLVNLLVDFRVSLFAYLRVFHTHAGRLNHVVDWAVALLVEQKAMVVFSLLFGVGLGIVVERAKARGVALEAFLLRRYLVLLVLGALHLVFVWSGDILAEYAVVALLTIPLVRLRPRRQVALGLALLGWWASPWPPPRLPFPSEATMARLAEGASRAYGAGTWAEAQAFRLVELRTGILSLLSSVLPRTLGLFLLGMAASAIVRRPPRRLLLALAAVGLPLGLLLSALDLLGAAGVVHLGELRNPVGNGSTLVLGLGYVGAFALAFERPRGRALASWLAPLGRMALTSYLTQSLVGIALFHHVGLGLMNHLGSATVAMLALVVFVAQAAFAARSLATRRFGPVEALWRRLSYGRSGA